MGTLYAYGDTTPTIGAGTLLFDSAEITGDVTVGTECVIGAGVKIIGDSHGPVRIGSRVQILENAVLHLCSPTTSWSSRTTSSSGPAP